MQAKVKNLIRITSAASLLLLLMTSGAIGQERTLDVLDQRVTINTSNLDIKQILELLAHKTKMPIGFEALPTGENTKIRINVQKGAARDVLDAVVREDTRYKWEIVNAVINVSPKERQDTVLDTVIQTFQVTDMNPEEISFAITDIPEIQAKLKSMNITQLGLQERYGSKLPLPRFSMLLTGLSLREILNEMLRMCHTTYWAITYYGEKNKYINIDLQSLLKTTRIGISAKGVKKSPPTPLLTSA